MVSVKVYTRKSFKNLYYFKKHNILNVLSKNEESTVMLIELENEKKIRNDNLLNLYHIMALFFKDWI